MRTKYIFIFVVLAFVTSCPLYAQTYTVRFASDNDLWGTVSFSAPLPAGVVDNGDGSFTVDGGTSVTLVATPSDACYDFSHWSDGNEDASREVNGDVDITAYFMLHVYGGDTTAIACDEFGWHDSTYTETPLAAPTFIYHTDAGCDSTVTLHLTINHSNVGDTAAVVCDSLVWHDSTYSRTPELAPMFKYTNVSGCDSIVTLNLTVNHSNTGDTTAVVCDSLVWHDSTYSVTPELEPVFKYMNVSGCDSIVTLHLTVNHSNTGDTTAVVCDSLVWYGVTYSTVPNIAPTHSFTNAAGCDSTVTLNLTINHSTTGDTSAVVCDSLVWYGATYSTLPAISPTHVFTNANGCDSTVTLNLTIRHSSQGVDVQSHCDTYRWINGHDYYTDNNTDQITMMGINSVGCDSTVTLNLTIRHSSNGVDSQNVCDSLTWIDGTTYTSNNTTAQYTLPGANAEQCDSLVDLNLTVHYSDVADTFAVVYAPYTWYEHEGMSVTQNVSHHFFNQWQCDSLVTLHLRYALFPTSWTGDTVVVYNSLPQAGLVASYVDDSNRTCSTTLTFTRGNEVVVSPNYPVSAGVWNVVATPVNPVDSLDGFSTTLRIQPAVLDVRDVNVVTAKFYDGTVAAEVTDNGILSGVQGTDEVGHITTAAFEDASVGSRKSIRLHYELLGNPLQVDNYVLMHIEDVYTNDGAIINSFVPNTQDEDPDGVQDGMNVSVYGYCTGSSARIGYRLASGVPNQYRLVFEDSRFEDVEWCNLPDSNNSDFIELAIPPDIPTGDYSVDVSFRDSQYPWLESQPLNVVFHVNLPETYTMPLFDNVIALVDTCHCFSDIQWYHRTDSQSDWEAIPGANGYYYREETGLTGEYFVHVKMNGVDTYTCPQSDLQTLIADTPAASVSIYPNPTSDYATIQINGSTEFTHVLQVMNTLGLEMEHRTFEGENTIVDLRGYQGGSYIISVDGLPVRVIKK